MSQHPRRRTTKTMRVLVIGHNLETWRDLIRGLQEAGHLVLDAENRTDAMRLMYEMQPDLIFLEVAASPNESRETFTGIRLVTETPVVLLACESSSPALDELNGQNCLILVRPIVVAQAIAQAQALLRAARSSSTKRQPAKKAATEPGHLKAHEVLAIDRALEEVGNGGQVRLIIFRGQLRFLAKLKAELLNAEMML
jgi:DNA-binding response OmpR family regulator